METQAYENAKLFKEKVKRWHHKRIQKREFKVGEYVLLYNSHFKLNGKLFKEKVKRRHHKRIQKREFKVGEYVLLYNSHFRFFAGKLLSKWEGRCVIEKVYRSGAIKINNAEGTNPKVVNGQCIN